MIPKPRQQPSRSTRTAGGAPESERPTTGPRPATYELIERITSLQLKMVPLDALADAVIAPLLDAFAAPAGGLLLYHSEDSSLRLTASRGLSAQGREHLATLRAGAAGGWEIPLHGLMNRKAYIIERPHEHPFVPELVERDETRPPANLACVPLYRGQLPVGVLLVIADRRPVTNPEVMAHVLVYDVLALALDAGMRMRGETPSPLPETAVAALACDEWTDPRDAARSLERHLALVTSERDELAERVAAVEAAHSEARGLLAAQKTLHRELLETERAESARRIAELEQASADEVARARQIAEQARANERAHLDEQLATERSAAAATIRELETTLADREAAFASTLQKLQTALHERETQLRDLESDRDRVHTAASDAGDVVRRLQSEIALLKDAQAAAEVDRERAFAETQAAFERQLADVTAEHRRVLERTETAHGTTVATARAAEGRAETLAAELAAVRDEVTSLRAERSQVLSALDAPGVEPATAVRLLRDQLAATDVALRELGAAHAELERRLAADAHAAEARLGTARRELHAAQAAHERTVEDLMAEHRHALDEAHAAARRQLEEADAQHRGALAAVRDDAQHKVEQERFDWQRRLDELRMESRQALDDTREALAAALERATAAERRADALAEDLAAVRAEVARLSEERASVLAAVDDPSAEPATVIRALRDQVAALEGQVGMIAAERSALERRAVVEAQAAEARLTEAHASAEARLAELRRAAQTSVDDARRAADATVAELRGALEERDRQLGVTDQSLRELADEQERMRRAAVETAEALRRSQADAERAHAELANARAAEHDVRQMADGAAERLVALERELGAARAELDRLHAERNRVLAAVDEPGTEPVAVIRALREQTAALDAQVRTLGAERSALVERAAADRAALDARVAAADAARAKAERLQGEQVSRIAALERDLIRSDEMLASARRQLDAAVERARVQAANAERPAPPPATPAAPTPSAVTASVRHAAPSVPRVEVLAPPPAPVIEAAGHRILEADPLVRERVAAALAAELTAASATALFVANLWSVLPDRLGELADAIEAGGMLVTYAAEAGRSRILGPIRCFADDPNPDMMLATLNKLGTQRRLISLSEDVDALIPLKASLSKAGHSISMACDPKQALDLLGMLTPDAVLIDLRQAPEAAAAFLDALALENGRTPAFLVTGHQPGTTLRQAFEPLLRPVPLDASALAKVCATVLNPPTPDTTPRTATRVVRPIDRTKAAPAGTTRKPLPRRVLTTKRR